MEVLSVFAQQIDLDGAGRVAVEIKSVTSAAVDLLHERIRYDHILEDVAYARVCRNARRGAYSEKIGSKTRVGEVYFVGFRNPLAKVVVVGTEREHDVGRTERRNPSRNRRFAHADIIREGLLVDVCFLLSTIDWMYSSRIGIFRTSSIVKGPWKRKLSASALAFSRFFGLFASCGFSMFI